MKNLRHPKKFDKGIVRFEEKASLFVALGVQKYVEPRKRRSVAAPRY